MTNNRREKLVRYQTAQSSSPPPERQIIRKIRCARNCGWERPYTDNLRWLNKLIDHPEWGKVTQAQAVQNDVYYHNCDTAAQASEKARRLFGTPRKPKEEENGNKESP